MVRRTALTSENLIALGADKLAKIILDEAGRNASFKKLVSAALAGAEGPKAVGAIVDGALPGSSELAASSIGRSARPSRPISRQRCPPSYLVATGGEQIRSSSCRG